MITIDTPGGRIHALSSVLMPDKDYAKRIAKVIDDQEGTWIRLDTVDGSVLVRMSEITALYVSKREHP